MSDDEAPKDVPPTPPPGGQYPPNWGSAYPPPPPGGQYPPNWGSAHPSPPAGGQYPPNYGSAYPPGGQPQPGYPQGYALAPKHPQATTAMILGIVGLTGLLCCVTALVAPFAWWLGAKAVKEIDANPATYSGRSEANAGKIMGIIGTILLILGVISIVGLFAIGLTSSSSSYDSNYFIGGIF